MKTRNYLVVILLLLSVAVYAQDTLKVRVMTYNLRFGELSTLDEIASHIKSFKPDFVALQEVDCKTDRKMAPHQKGKDFISELAYKTGMFGLYGKTIKFSGGYYGIGILSVYPYINVNKEMLPNPGKSEPRALLEGCFEAGGDTVIFAATHLDVKDASTRDLQAQYITDYFSSSKYPVLLGGDFNAAPGSKTIKDVMLKQWVPLTNDDLSFPAWNPRVKIDYLFGLPLNGWKLVRTQTVQSQLSDHLPVITELEYIRK